MWYSFSVTVSVVPPGTAEPGLAAAALCTASGVASAHPVDSSAAPAAAAASTTPILARDTALAYPPTGDANGRSWVRG
jgi:hypothetical protein